MKFFSHKLTFSLALLYLFVCSCFLSFFEKQSKEILTCESKWPKNEKRLISCEVASVLPLELRNRLVFRCVFYFYYLTFTSTSLSHRGLLNGGFFFKSFGFVLIIVNLLLKFNLTINKSVTKNKIRMVSI